MPRSSGAFAEQSGMLSQAWEARLRGSPHAHAPDAGTDLRASAAAAVKAWSRVDRRARHALKRAHFELVHALEVQMWHHLSVVRHHIHAWLALPPAACASA